MSGFRRAFPDLKGSYDEMILTDDRFVARRTLQGTNTGCGSLPFPPTGKFMKTVGCLVIHMKDRKILEEWQYTDFLGMMQQLGFFKPLGSN